MELTRNTVIESIGMYLPSQSVSTSDILSGCKNKIQFPLENITGISHRRVAAENEFSIDLAKNGITDCLAKSKYNPGDIDLLICCNISRYDDAGSMTFEPNTSIKLRKHFGFSNAIVFDITNACAGMFTGIYIANALIKNGAVKRALIVSGEYITHLSQTAQRDIESFMDTRLACLTLGDAGAALILEEAVDTNTGFQELELQTFGAYSKYCVSKASEQGGMIMFTDSVKLTDVAVKSGAHHAMKSLEKAEWPAESFDHLIMHQTSRMTLNSARREINRLLNAPICNDGNTINNLDQRGNTASTAHFVALVDHIRNNKIQSGDKIVFSISASGLTVGTGLYILDDLPDRFRHMESHHAVAEKQNVKTSQDAVSNVNVSRMRIESVGTIPQQANAASSMELVKSAANNCFLNSSYECAGIGLLIYCGVYRSEYLLEPAYASLLAGELNMNATSPAAGTKATLAFDIFNGSIGFLQCCYVAQQMLAAGTCTNAMIATAEKENNTGMFPNEVVGFCETASAIIVDSNANNNSGFSRFVFNYHAESIEAYTASFKTGHSNPHLHVEKNDNLEALYLEYILPAVHELLRLEKLDKNRINKIFPPQISSNFIINLSQELKVPLNRFIDVVGDGPDLFSSSLPYAFEVAIEQELVKPGDIGLMIAVGSGIQVGCAIYYF